MPLRWQRKFSAVRSPVNSPRAGPSMVAITSPGATTLPSGRSASSRWRDRRAEMHSARYRARQRRRAGARAAPARRPVGRHDGIRGDVAGPSEVFEQGGSNQRLVHEGQKRGKRHGWALPQTEIRFQQSSRAASSASASEMEDGTRRGQGVGKVAAEMRAAAFLAPPGGDRDHQSHQRGIGCRAVAVGERIEAADRRSMPCRSRSTPRPCDRIGRTRKGRMRAAGALAARVFSGPRLAPLDALRDPRAHTRSLRSANCWRAGWRHAARCG